jgi:leader peptidase (prepilin peptidase)/N-methyltransferase
MALLDAVLAHALPGVAAERALPAWVYRAHLAAAALLLALSSALFSPLRASAAAVFCLALVLVSLADLQHRLIPNRVVLPAAGLVLALMSAAEPSWEWPLAALAASGSLLVLALVYPAGMGMGDVKLAFLMGAALGRGVGLALLLAIVAAALPSLAILLRRGWEGRTVGIPFAPFLALGSLVALFAEP